jgi:hypothetical protein
MTTPIGIQGSIPNSDWPGHRVLVHDDRNDGSGAWVIEMQSGDAIRIGARHAHVKLASGQAVWEDAP